MCVCVCVCVCACVCVTLFRDFAHAPAGMTPERRCRPTDSPEDRVIFVKAVTQFMVNIGGQLATLPGGPPYTVAVTASASPSNAYWEGG